MGVAEALVVFVLGACAGSTVTLAVGFVVVDRWLSRRLGSMWTGRGPGEPNG